jgi:hypothetical protein
MFLYHDLQKMNSSLFCPLNNMPPLCRLASGTCLHWNPRSSRPRLASGVHNPKRLSLLHNTIRHKSPVAFGQGLPKISHISEVTRTFLDPSFPLLHLRNLRTQLYVSMFQPGTLIPMFYWSISTNSEARDHLLSRVLEPQSIVRSHNKNTRNTTTPHNLLRLLHNGLWVAISKIWNSF